MLVLICYLLIYRSGSIIFDATITIYDTQTAKTKLIVALNDLETGQDTLTYKGVTKTVSVDKVTDITGQGKSVALLCINNKTPLL